MFRAKAFPVSAFTVLLSLALHGCGTSSIKEVMTSATETAKQSLTPANILEGSPVTLYTQIAQGVNACWFSPKSKLRKNHMFHAMTSPDRKYAMAAIHEIDKTSGERGLKSFWVELKEEPKGTAIAIQNLRFRQNIATQMHDDVMRWAKGDPECSKPLTPPFNEENPVAISNSGFKPVVTPVKNANPASKP